MDQKNRDYVKEHMPQIGMGTWQIRKEETLYSVFDAGFRVGYRHIDTAQVYANESAIGRCLKRLLPSHGLERSDIWITSKLEPSKQGAEKAAASIEKSLQNLQTDYIDLLLIHWPGSWLKSEDQRNQQLRRESWEVMCDYLEKGKLRSIGVSNFEIRHLDEMKQWASVMPAVNQVEYHPHYHQEDLLEYCRLNEIVFQAYSSLGSPTYRKALFEDDIIMEMAKRYNVSVAVLLLGFAYCQGIWILPRTTNPDHAVENFKVTKFSITEKDIEKLKTQIKTVHKACWDPVKVC